MNNQARARAPGDALRINDDMLVVVMIETLEGVANADEIASRYGVDVVILGNNDLSQFSGWSQNDHRYQDALIKVHDAGAGK
jgi:2-keto-3-deoxy-L-rhamnonate aldolase RhmA